MFGIRLQAGAVLQHLCNDSGRRGTGALASAANHDVVFTIDPAASIFGFSGTNSVYGDYVPQLPGSNESPVTGHFLVSFDPTTNTPTTIQLIGSDGYYQPTTPLTMQTSTPGITFDYTGLTWDFDSPVIPGAGGSFTADTTHFTVSEGVRNYTYAGGGGGVDPVAPYDDQVTTGTWQLSEIGAGSGNWQLSVSGYYASSLSWPSPYGSGSVHFALDATSYAQFGTDNIAELAPTDTSASVLGGAATPGGVSINLPGPTDGGTFTAQQIPDTSGLSQAAVTAAETNPVFAASTADLSVNPQIWTVDYTGLVGGQTATLVFHYDPALLPVGLDESQLGIWHFNGTDWDFGGTVNTLDHTIAFDTTSFSPFVLGVSVPEPGTLVLAAMGAAALGVVARRRRYRQD